jgi:peptide/nickel transport system permease protein
MWGFLARRVATALLVTIGVVVLVFLVVRVLPGDGAALRAGPYASAERIEQIRRDYGLDHSLLQQFLSYLNDLAHGKFGVSMRTGENVTKELFERLPASLELAFYSVTLASLFGLPLGAIAAINRGKFMDQLIRVFSVIGSSMALFWLGILLIYLFFYKLGWAPGPVGRMPIGQALPESETGFLTIDAVLNRRFDVLGEALKYLALPVITLAFVLSAPIIKITRIAVLNTLNMEHIRTAKSIGVSSVHLIWRDVFRNAAIPIVTTIGIVFGYMLGGNVIIEFLFSWPGVGRYAYVAIQNSDIDAIQGFVLLIGFLYVLMNLVIDFIYMLIDPRVRLGNEREI